MSNTDIVVNDTPIKSPTNYDCLISFITLKYGNIYQLSKYLGYDHHINVLTPINIQTFNIDYFFDYTIIKKPDSDTYLCMGKTMKKLNDFHLYQILMMKISYKSFNTTFDYFPTSIYEITPEYIEQFTNIVRPIFDIIIANTNTDPTNKVVIAKPTFVYECNDLTHTDVCEQNIWVSNIKLLLNSLNTTFGKYNKLPFIRDMFNYIYTHIKLTHKNPNFAKTVIGKIFELKMDIDVFIFETLLSTNIDQIEYDKIIIVFKTINSILRTHLLVNNTNIDNEFNYSNAKLKLIYNNHKLINTKTIAKSTVLASPTDPTVLASPTNQTDLYKTILDELHNESIVIDENIYQIVYNKIYNRLNK